jgi:hypothetical protein
LAQRFVGIELATPVRRQTDCATVRPDAPNDSAIIGRTAGVSAYFCTAIVAVVAHLFVYTRITPHDEFKLIRDNDPAVAIALIFQIVRIFHRQDARRGRRCRR